MLLSSLEIKTSVGKIHFVGPLLFKGINKFIQDIK